MKKTELHYSLYIQIYTDMLQYDNVKTEIIIVDIFC
jgi:hypothetical protein